MQRNKEMKDLNNAPSRGVGNCSRFIPEDLMSQCLVRLPVKSLIRFKAVSKPWRNLISSAGFAEMHFRHSKSNEQILGVGLHSEKYYPVMSLLKLGGSKDAESDGLGNVSLPLRLQPIESVVIEGSCNGLLVFRSKSSPGIVLGNLATREFRHLSLPVDEVRFSTSIEPSFSEFCTSVGLCYVSETNDYKIVVIQNVHGERSSSGIKGYPGWVYSLNSDSWKKLDIAFPYIKSRILGLSGMPTIFNERLHWIADEDEGRIAAIDVKSEVLQYMSMPAVPEQLVWRSGRLLTIIEGSLSLVISLSNERRDLGCEVWKMNEYGVEASWTKLFSIGKFQISTQLMGSSIDGMEIIVQPMGSWKERMMLFKFYWGNGDLLFSYDPSTGTREIFFMTPVLNLQVINYVETMESVERGMTRISQSRMMAEGCSSHGIDSGNSSTGVVVPGGQDNKKEDDPKSPTSGKEHHNDRTLEGSRNFEGETSRKGKGKLE